METIRQISKDTCGAACLMMAAAGLRGPQGALYSSIKSASRPLEVSTEVGIVLAALKDGFHAEAFRSGGALSLKECIEWVKLCERGRDFGGALNARERKKIANEFRATYRSSEMKIRNLLHEKSKISADFIAHLAARGFCPMVLVDDFFIDGKLPHDAHWVVASGFSRGTFTVNDPGFPSGAGILRMPKERFAKAIETGKTMGMQRRMVLVCGGKNHFPLAKKPRITPRATAQSAARLTCK